MKCLLCGDTVQKGKICLSCATKTEGKVCFVEKKFGNFFKKKVLIMGYDDVVSLFGKENADKHIHFIPPKYFAKLVSMCNVE